MRKSDNLLDHDNIAGGNIMTYLGYGFSEGKIYVSQDTVVSRADTRKPFFCMEKMIYVKNLNCIIAGTGDLRLIFRSWQIAWNSKNINQLLDELPIATKKYREDASKIHCDYLVKSTIFVFFFENKQPRAVRLTFFDGILEPIIEEISENLQDGKIAFKPDGDKFDQTRHFLLKHQKTLDLIHILGSKDGLVDQLAGYALWAHLTDCSSPQLEQTGIGGELKLMVFTEDGLEEHRNLLVFPDNNKHSVPTNLLSPDEALAKMNEPN